MQTLTVHAPTKINLRLKVVGKRADGYHLLSMLNEKLLFGDKLHVCAEGIPQKNLKNFDIKLHCPRVRSLESESNLIVKAARRFSEEFGVATPLTIELEKNIPVGAGLGGGSSDAAAIIRALNKIWGVNKSKEELAEFGVTIGADVPFFIYPGAACVTGIGDHVNPDIRLPKLWILLINPGFEVSTKEVYEGLHLELTQNIDNDRFPTFFNNLDALSPYVANDLERVVSAKCSVIGEMKRFLEDKEAKIVFMSGSGPTVVGIFNSKEERDAAFDGAPHTGWRVIPTENAAG